MDDLGNRVSSNTIHSGASSSSVSYVLDTGATNEDTNRYTNPKTFSSPFFNKTNITSKLSYYRKFQPADLFGLELHTTTARQRKLPDINAQTKPTQTLLIQPSLI